MTTEGMKMGTAKDRDYDRRSEVRSHGWTLYRVGLSWYAKMGERASFRDPHVGLSKAEALRWAKVTVRASEGK